MSTKAYTYGYGICVEKIKDVEKDRLLSLIRMASEFYGEYQEWEEEWKLGEGYEPDVEDILVDFVEDCAQVFYRKSCFDSPGSDQRTGRHRVNRLRRLESWGLSGL